jgi:hypothetical protein
MVLGIQANQSCTLKVDTRETRVISDPELRAEESLPAISRIPSFTTDKIARVAPLYGVLAALAHGVDGRTSAVSPPRVVVAIVVTRRAGRGALTRDEGRGRVCVVALAEEVKGGGKRGDCCAREEQEWFEGDHCDLREGVLLLGLMCCVEFDDSDGWGWTRRFLYLE